MGLFDIIKAIFPKKQDKGQIYEKMYEQKSLKELLDELNNADLKTYEAKQISALRLTYLKKLFGDPVEEGGFGLKDYPGYMQAVYAAGAASDSAPYKFGMGKNERIQNYEIEFLKNCVKRGGNASSMTYFEALRCIFPLDKDWMFTKAELKDENFPLYHPWVLMGENERLSPSDEFLHRKLFTVRIITDEEQLEAYGLFKQVEGEPTDEYVTIEDFLEAKNNTQLKRLLDTFQTRDGEGDELD